jgi:hypothetical protein
LFDEDENLFARFVSLESSNHSALLFEQTIYRVFSSL